MQFLRSRFAVIACPARLTCARGGRLVDAGGRPALTGTWVNAREGTRGGFACRLEEEAAQDAAAAAAAHCSGLWVGEAKPAAEFEWDVPVRGGVRFDAFGFSDNALKRPWFRLVCRFRWV
jgi:hypothetical protein